jgi:tetratricopeptide (TPR) repeat protein
MGAQMKKKTWITFSLALIAPAISLASPASSESEAYVKQGIILEDKGQIERADRAFEDALQSKKDNADAMLHLAGTRLLLCQRESAVDLSQRVLAIESNATALYFVVAIRWQQGRLEEAKQAFHDYVANIRDPEKRIKEQEAEGSLFSKAALGEFGRIRGLKDRECS